MSQFFASGGQIIGVSASASVLAVNIQDISGGGLVAKSCPTLVTPWTVACQAPLSMGFFRHEVEWVAISFFRGSSHPGIELSSPILQGYSLPTELQRKHSGH